MAKVASVTGATSGIGRAHRARLRRASASAVVAHVATDGNRKAGHLGRHVTNEDYGALPPSDD